MRRQPFAAKRTAALTKKETALSVAVAVIAAERLTPSPRNSRVHSADQIEQIKASIREFGYTSPILHDAYEIVAGHGRHKAVTEMYEAGETITLPSGAARPAGAVPVIDVSGWSEEQRRAYVIADNKIAENATWDDDLLKLEVTFLDAAAFDTSLTGLDGRALAEILASDTVAIGGNKDQARSGAKPLNLRIGGQQVPLTQAEHDGLLAELQHHVDKTGALYGFAAFLLDAVRAPDA